MIGTVIDHYKITSRIAAGGMGEVYRAMDLELDREVAIKCVRPELSELDEATQRFRTEARTLARLSHPNIATVHRFFAHEERLFLVMEFIDGKPFGDMIGDVTGDNGLPFERSIKLVQDALKGLGYAHANDVVHRDIKPGNLMVDQQSTVKVLDFGIAHLVGGTRLTRVGSVVGTPAYMAPEQILGKDIDPRTDLYSIGVVLYEMLVGKLPYEGNTDFEIMRAHLESVPRPLQELSDNNVPDALQLTISRAMAKETGERFQTADEFASALSSVEQDSTKHYVPPAVSSRAKTEVLPTPQDANEETLSEVLKPVAQEIRKRLNFQQIALGAVAALVIAFGLFTALQPNQSTQDRAATVNEAAGNTESFAADSQTNAQASDVIESVSDTANGSVAEQSPRQSAEQPTDPLTKSPADTIPSPGIEQQTAARETSTVSTTGSTVQAEDTAAQNVSPPEPRPVIATQVTPPARTNREGDRQVAASTTPIAVEPQIEVSIIKVDAHDRQGTGRFHRTAAYNGAFNLTVPDGMGRTVKLEEVVEIYRNGELVRSNTIVVETRVAGEFKSKHRIEGLKTLPRGEYDMRLIFVHDGKTVGTHTWQLRVG